MEQLKSLQDPYKISTGCVQPNSCLFTTVLVLSGQRPSVHSVSVLTLCKGSVALKRPARGATASEKLLIRLEPQHVCTQLFIDALINNIPMIL